MADSPIKQRKWHIYKITCIASNKSYIGLTCDSVKQRWSNHVSSAVKFSTNSVFHKAIRKYGRDAFVVEILLVLPSLAAASSAEISAISEFKTLIPNGYNVALGGAGTPGVRFTHSAATRAKMSASAVGRPKSDQARKLMSIAKKGKPLSAEHCQKLSEVRMGKFRSEATRKKMSKSAVALWARRKALRVAHQ